MAWWGVRRGWVRCWHVRWRVLRVKAGMACMELELVHPPRMAMEAMAVAMEAMEVSISFNQSGN